MKTTQKNTWMRHLIIGILGSYIVLSVSCQSEVDKPFYQITIYYNNSDYQITMDGYRRGKINETLSISMLDSVFQEGELTFGDNSNQIIWADSVYLIFNSNKIIKWNRNNDGNSASISNRNILYPHNYVYNKVGKNTEYLRYTFTNEDYNNAEEIDGG